MRARGGRVLEIGSPVDNLVKSRANSTSSRHETTRVVTIPAADGIAIHDISNECQKSRRGFLLGWGHGHIYTRRTSLTSRLDYSFNPTSTLHVRPYPLPI